MKTDKPLPKTAKALLLMIVLLPSLMGGAHTATNAAAALFLVLLIVVDVLKNGKSLQLTWLSLAFFVASGWTLIQQLPLPTGALSFLSPKASSLIFTAHELTSTPAPKTHRLSLDIVQTADRCLKFILPALAITLGHMHFRRKSSVHMLGGAIAASGAVALLVGFINYQIDPSRFFTFYTPVRPFSFASTFVNPNHMAVFFALITLVSATFRFNPNLDTSEKAESFFMVATIVSSLVCLATMSAGTILCLIAAACLWGLIRKQNSKKLATAVLLAIPALSLVTWGLLLGSPRGALPEHSSSDASFMTRIDLTRAAARIAADYPLTGAGAGSIERIVYPYYDNANIESYRVDYIENQLAEWFATLGFPVALVIIASLLAAALHHKNSKRNRGYGNYAGPLIGVSAFTLLISQIHFPFFVTGVSVPLMIWWQAQLDSTVSKQQSSNQSTLVASLREQGRFALSKRTSLALALFALSAISLSISTHVIYSSAHKEPNIEVASLATLPTLATQLPSEAVVFTTLTKNLLEEKQTAKALACAEHASKLEPKPKVKLTLALARTLAGDPNGDALHRELIGHSIYGNRALSNMLALIPSTERRASILAAHPDKWETAVQYLERVGQTTFIQPLLMHLRAKSPDSTRLDKIQLQQYARSGDWLLAETFALSLLAREPARHPIAYEALIDALLAQQNYTAAVEYLTTHPTSWDVSSLRERKVIEEAPQLHKVEGFEDPLSAAIESTCDPPPSDLSRACHVARAHLMEKQGLIAEAGEQWEKIADGENSPIPLANFYLRHGRCGALRLLLIKEKKSHTSSQLPTVQQLTSRLDSCDSSNKKAIK